MRELDVISHVLFCVPANASMRRTTTRPDGGRTPLHRSRRLRFGLLAAAFGWALAANAANDSLTPVDIAAVNPVQAPEALVPPGSPADAGAQAVAAHSGEGQSQSAHSAERLRLAQTDQGKATADVPELAEIVVTAQKRSESINDVGMSISAISGDSLVRRGITDVSQLSRVVPGFNFSQNGGNGSPVYTLRGIGFNDTSVAAAPTVSVYVDEVPLPFPAETVGATLDLERVEVLKGPQGTLYGQNSTGGAINYIAAKPTDTFKAGFDASYGRFNKTDLSGFVSGPLSDTLEARVAIRYVGANGWQESFTRTDTLGSRNMFQGRLLLDWRPVDDLKVSVNVNGWNDLGETQAPQIVGHSLQTSQNSTIPAGLANYPLSPPGDRLADWDIGRDYHKNTNLFQSSLRADYSFGSGPTLTSITSYERYRRYAPFDADGTTYQDFFITNQAHVSTVSQEIRLSGDAAERYHWIIGGNYESDNAFDKNFIEFADSTSHVIFGLPDHNAYNQNTQDTKNYAGFGNIEYNLSPSLTAQGGVRYTQANRSFAGCTRDSGDGLTAAVFSVIAAAGQRSLGSTSIVPVPVGGCATLNAEYIPSLITNTLDEHNVSWRTGLNWKLTENVLAYANVSRGYKAGSFPLVSATSYLQFNPVTRESVTAYESGFKVSVYDRALQFNGAGFYYDYKNKQVTGVLPDPFLGNLSALVNIPESRVVGFELNAIGRPFAGLTISPSITLVDSKVLGSFNSFTPLNTKANFGGEPFPLTSKWSGNTDVEYKWGVKSTLDAYVGANASYQSATNSGFGELQEFSIRGYTLVDLRAGVESPDGQWRVGVFGQNVGNVYYWSAVVHGTDTTYRYTGRPLEYGLRASLRF
jgi:iron complex outermembrane recepter protein